MKPLLEKLIPFIFIGIALVAFGFGLLILAYLFLIGAILGLILFLVSWIREQILSKQRKKQKHGRTIDSDDYKLM